MLGGLRLRRRGGARLFPPAPDPGAARRGIRARLREGARDRRRSSAEKSARRCSSSATCCGRSSTRLHHAYVLAGGIPPGCFVPREEAPHGGGGMSAAALNDEDRSGSPGLGAAEALRCCASAGCCWCRSGCSSPARPRCDCWSGWRSPPLGAHGRRACRRIRRARPTSSVPTSWSCSRDLVEKGYVRRLDA